MILLLARHANTNAESMLIILFLLTGKTLQWKHVTVARQFSLSK